MKIKPWQLLAVLAVGAVALIAGFYAFSQWQRSGPAEPVDQMRVSFATGAQEVSVEPYTVCELDAQCDGGEPPTAALDPAGEVTVTVPKELASGSWRLLSIYDDPAANDERVVASGEATQASAPATKDGARLVVAEVSTLAVDTDPAGQEVPVVATWSVAFEGN